MLDIHMSTGLGLTTDCGVSCARRAISTGACVIVDLGTLYCTFYLVIPQGYYHHFSSVLETQYQFLSLIIIVVRPGWS
jgi:hypothetical protein